MKTLREMMDLIESAQAGVAEGLNDTVYPGAEVIKSKNGKPVGEIYQDGNSWGAFHYKADRGYDFIDSREDAVQALKDLHQETGRSRPDYTIKGVAEGIRVVDQDYDLDQVILTLDVEGKKASFTYTDYDGNFENAERRDVFDQLQEKSWYKGLDHPTKMEILDAAYRAIRGEEPSEYKPTVDDEPMDEQGVAEAKSDDPDYDETLKRFKKGLPPKKKQDVAEEQVEESTPDALAKIDDLFRK